MNKTESIPEPSAEALAALLARKNRRIAKRHFPKEAPCAFCGGLFSIKGINQHIRFKHKTPDDLRSSAAADLRTRILDGSMPEPNSGCWLWINAENSRGYGKIRIGAQRRMGAHRASYMAFVGDPKNGLICHKCDTPMCVNPDHLYLGTAKTNGADMVSRGRSLKGRRHVKKLTEEAVRLIRESGSIRKLAKRFNVSPSAIVAVRTGLTWKHVKQNAPSAKPGEGGAK